MGAIIVVLYPWAGCRTDFSPFVWGGQPSLRMPTNKSPLVAGIEPGLVRQSEQSLPAEPSPCFSLLTHIVASYRVKPIVHSTSKLGGDYLPIYAQFFFWIYMPNWLKNSYRIKKSVLRIYSIYAQLSFIH